MKNIKLNTILGIVLFAPLAVWLNLPVKQVPLPLVMCIGLVAAVRAWISKRKETTDTTK